MQSQHVKQRRAARFSRRSVPSWYRRAINARLSELRRSRTLNLSDAPDVVEIRVRTKAFNDKLKTLREELQTLTLCSEFGKVSKKQFQANFPLITLP